MYESSIVQYFTEKGVEQGVKQGMEQGVKQGMEQGIEQGIRESLLDVLAQHFPAAAVQQVAGRIEKIKDVEHLKELLCAAVHVPSLEAFTQLLDAK